MVTLFLKLFQISEGRVLAYRQVPGQLRPTMLVVPGNKTALGLSAELKSGLLVFKRRMLKAAGPTLSFL